MTWLTFDIIGTVFDAQQSLSMGIRRVAKQHALTVDAEKLAGDWIDQYAFRAMQVAANLQLWMPPDRLLRNAFADLFNADQTGGRLSAGQVAAFVALWRTLEPWPDVAAGMRRLHARLKLAVLSNMSVATQTALKKHSRLPFDRLLSAEAAKTYKPNRAVYESAVRRLRIKPECIMMVAAHPPDLDAAQACGFRTAYVKRPWESGRRDTADHASTTQFDITASSMEDLATRLGL